MKKILSISIAAYNVEKYISKTLDSILESKYRDELDIVITNDGSKDNTGSIIYSYKKKYPDIINFIDQENSGAGSTVNNGIKNAKGKYLKMVDGDDWVVTENLDKLIEYLKKSDSDAVVTNFKYYFESSGDFKSGISYNIINEKEYDFNDICNQLDIGTSTVTYKTELLQKNNIEVSKRFYSDYQFQVYPIPFIKTISYIDTEVYVYRIGREGQSVSIKGYQSHIDDHQNVMYQLIEFYEKNKKRCSENIKIYILNKVSKFINIDVSVMLSFKASKVNKGKIKKIMDSIEKQSKDIYDYSIQQRIVKLLVKSNYSLYGILSLMKRIKIGK